MTTAPAALAAQVSLGLGAAALVVGLLVLLDTRRLSVALPVFLDLLLAAGLLRLSADGTWGALATAAALVAVRKLVVRGLTANRSLRHRSRPSEPGAVA